MTLFGGLVPSSASQQTQLTQAFRVLEYQYGNGYTGRVPDGANPQRETWGISFDNLNATDSATLDTWLAASPPWVTFVGDGAILSASKTYWMTKEGFVKTPLPGTVNSYMFNLEQSF